MANLYERVSEDLSEEKKEAPSVNFQINLNIKTQSSSQVYIERGMA